MMNSGVHTQYSFANNSLKFNQNNETKDNKTAEISTRIQKLKAEISTRKQKLK